MIHFLQIFFLDCFSFSLTIFQINDIFAIYLLLCLCFVFLRTISSMILLTHMFTGILFLISGTLNMNSWLYLLNVLFKLFLITNFLKAELKCMKQTNNMRFILSYSTDYHKTFGEGIKRIIRHCDLHRLCGVIITFKDLRLLSQNKF